MLLVKFLGRGKKQGIHVGSRCFNQESKKNIPVSWDFPMELIKTLNVS